MTPETLIFLLETEIKKLRRLYANMEQIQRDITTAQIEIQTLQTRIIQETEKLDENPKKAKN